jgi:putative redox protein
MLKSICIFTTKFNVGCLDFMEQKNLLDQDIVGSIGTQKYYEEIIWRNGILVMDEPENLGGKDLGIDPFSTLLAALAGCTLSTLRMYIDRKEWAVPAIKVALNMYKDSETKMTVIKRDISFPEGIEDEYRARLLQIAAQCPVSKILEGDIKINTTI